MVSSEPSLVLDGSGETLNDMDFCSFSLTVASAAATEETEGLDLLPADPRASAPLPVDCEDELAEDECLLSLVPPAGESSLANSSESAQAESSSRVAMLREVDLPTLFHDLELF